MKKAIDKQKEKSATKEILKAGDKFVGLSEVLGFQTSTRKTKKKSLYDC